MRRVSARALRIGTLATAGTLVLSGCGFSPYDLPLPGGADLGDKPFTVTAEFRDVLDLVPQSGVRVNDLAVGKVTDIQLDGWTAKVTLQVNGDVDLPDNAVATIRQTSLLGEKFVSLEPPATGGTGKLSQGDNIPLERSGRNPEVEEVFSAASLLFNGGGLERTNTIVKELNATLDGNEPEIKELLSSTETFLGQLDDNKQALITSLEKVNRLAVATNEQKDAITGALDDLPEALDVVNDQRDDLVKLLQSLDNLGDVATDVIKRSKADTVADLKALTPILRNLSEASDDLAYDFKALLTFPFADGMAADGFERPDGTFTYFDPKKGLRQAGGTCENPAKNPENTGWCTGDYANLSIHLNVDQGQLEGLLGINLPDLAGAAGAGGAATQGSASSEVEDLQKILEGIPGLGGSTSGSASTSKAAGPCLLGFLACRPAAASGTVDRDLTSLLTDPARGGDQR